VKQALATVALVTALAAFAALILMTVAAVSVLLDPTDYMSD
jgi:hypothetical protein